MFMSRQGPDHLCGHCSRHPWHFGLARSAGVFDQGLATLVHRLKYNHQTRLAKPLGALMLAVLLDNWNPAKIDWVVPVPLHRTRLRERGFNQSFLLAQAWASTAKAGPAKRPLIPVNPDLLQRTRPTASQTGLGRRARVTNLKNAFRVSPGNAAAGARLLLVDDVFTTGATVNECARVLMQAGARRVDVLTLARTHIGYGKLHHGKNIQAR
jgi:ComF family protein